MKSRPKSPLDSSPLERGAGRGHGYFEETDPKQELFSEKEQSCSLKQSRAGKEKRKKMYINGRGGGGGSLLSFNFFPGYV